MSKEKLICRHCDHEEHLDTKCYEEKCECVECHTKDDLRTLYKFTNSEALFNGA